MRADFLAEPELEFGGGSRHVDIRFGLMNYGPLDAGASRAHSPIRVGIVGSASTAELLGAWIERCRSEVPAKASRRRNYFAAFPGFASAGPFGTELAVSDRLTSVVTERTIAGVLGAARPDASAVAARELAEHVRHLVDTANPDVVIVAPPRELLDYLDDFSPSGGARDEPPPRRDLHDLLKARALSFAAPIQFMRPETYDERQRRKQRGRSWLDSSTQDEATRAWNLHTALYYKAGGIPWRLARDARHPTACFVGLSFYWTRDREELQTSVAHVFNERGDGMIMRGGPGQIDKSDRTPYLSRSNARDLLASALNAYRREHLTAPARVVIHKSARVVPDEVAGFRDAIDAERIDSMDVMSIGHRTGMRLFRRAQNAPLRGTRLSLDEVTDLVLTRGSVDFYQFYPGMYVPSPILVRYHEIQQTPRQLAAEILALTKMNWNNTSFDGLLPITLRAARQVRDILRHTEPEAIPQARYAYYM